MAERVMVNRDNLPCLNKPDISISKLLSKDLAILSRDGTLSFSSTVKINECLNSRHSHVSRQKLGGRSRKDSQRSPRQRACCFPG